MKAVCWNGKSDVRVERTADPGLVNPRDVIVRVTSASISGSDLHAYDGYVPGMQQGDILGHEFMGEVVEVARQVQSLRPGDRVVVPPTIACGKCAFCQHEQFSLCDNSNPNAWMAEKTFGYPTAGIFGYSHLFGGYAGGLAEYVRVPFADVGPVKVPDGLPDEKVLFASDALPTGYMAAEACEIQSGDIVAVWGCGAIGQFAMKMASLFGAHRVIAIDRVPERLQLARAQSGAHLVNYDETNVFEALRDLTGGAGPDACIDAVGLEAHGKGPGAIVDLARQAAYMETDRPTVLRQMIEACRKGGKLSIAGSYVGMVDKFPIGVAFNKGLTFKMGQVHGRKYSRLAMERISRGEIDPSFVATHKMTLDEAPRAFEMFKRKQNGCVRVVMAA